MQILNSNRRSHFLRQIGPKGPKKEAKGKEKEIEGRKRKEKISPHIAPLGRAGR
jgi:hypothetical protein